MQTLYIYEQNIFIDDEDYKIIKNIRWHLQKNKGRNLYHAVGRPLNKNKMLMHRFIYYLHNIEIPKNMEIDHINGNGLDNRKINLRISTHQDNILNRHGPQKNSKTKCVGVQYMKELNKFRAYVCINRKSVHIGVYTTIKDACNSRNKYIIENNLKCKQYEYFPTLFRFHFIGKSFR